MKYFFWTLALIAAVRTQGQGIGVETYRLLSDPWGDAVEASRDLLGTPQKRSQVIAGFTALVIADPWLTSRWQQHIEPLQDPIRSAIHLPFYYQRTPLGPYLVNSDGLAFNWIVGGYIAGSVFKKPRIREAAVLCGKVAVENFLVNHIILKTAFGRNRPLRPLNNYVTVDVPQPYIRDGYPYVNNPMDFFNDTRVSIYGTHVGTAMPSFHSSLYFGFAAVLDETLLPWYVAYPLALFPFAYDLRDHNHWVSDMVVAGVIGTALGKAAVHRYDRRKARATNLRARSVASNAIWYPTPQGIGFRATW